MGLSDDIRKSRNIKEKSLNAYLIALKKMYRLISDNENYDSSLFNNVGFLKKKNYNKIIDFLDTLKLPTRKNYLAAILVALTANDKDNEVIKQYRNHLETIAIEYQDQISTKKKSNKLSDNWVTMAELKKIVGRYKRNIKEKKLVSKEAFNNADFDLFQRFLIGSLYTLLPPVRNDYADMEVISFKDYNKLKDKDNNYLVIVGKNKKFFSFGAYKTSEVYGIKMVQIPAPLNKIINTWLNYNKTGYFIISKQKKPITDNGLTKLLYKTFSETGKNIGSTIIRHIYLSEKYGDINDEKEADSDAMMHSLATQKEYVKK